MPPSDVDLHPFLSFCPPLVQPSLFLPDQPGRVKCAERNDQLVPYDSVCVGAKIGPCECRRRELKPHEEGGTDADNSEDPDGERRQRPRATARGADAGVKVADGGAATDGGSAWVNDEDVGPEGV